MIGFCLTYCLARAGLRLMRLPSETGYMHPVSWEQSRAESCSETPPELNVAPLVQSQALSWIAISSGHGADVPGEILGSVAAIRLLSIPDRACQRMINVFFAQICTFRFNHWSRQTYYCNFWSIEYLSVSVELLNWLLTLKPSMCLHWFTNARQAILKQGSHMFNTNVMTALPLASPSQLR